MTKNEAASVAKLTDEQISRIAMGVEAHHPEFHKVSTAAVRSFARALLAAPAAPATGESGAEFSAGMAHAAEICDRRETEAWADYERTKSKHAKGEADGLVNAAHAIRAEIAATPPAAKSAPEGESNA